MRAHRTTSTTGNTGNTGTTGTPSTPRRRRLRPAGALIAVLLAAAGLTAVPSPGTAAVRNSDARLISTFPAAIAAVYSTSTEPAEEDGAGAPTTSRTAAAATAVSNACASGEPLTAAQWYTLPAAGASRVTVVPDQTDRDEATQEQVSFGFVTSDSHEVLSCGDAPVSLPANRPVLLVAYFAQSVPPCENDDWAYWCDWAVTLATVHRVATKTPANDNWQDAKAISGDTFSTTVDTSTATFDGLGPIRQGECFLSQIDPVSLGNVWFTYKPSFTGHVSISARSPKPGYWAWPVIAEVGPDGSPIEPEPDGTDECLGTTNVEAGKTYLIGIGGWYSPYFGESNPIGGEVSVSVGPAPAQRVVRDLQVSVNNSARSARLDWGIWEDGGPTPSGFRVGRSSTDGTAYATFDDPDRRSYTFKNLKAWEPYLLTVDTLGSGSSGSAPRATAFAYLSQPQPSKPLSVSATISGYKKATVKWSPPAFDGDHAVSKYRIRQFGSTGSTAQKTWTVSADKRSLAATGLSFNKGYRFDVTALNAAGTGQPSARTSSIKLTGIPSAPTGVKVTRQVSKRTATLTWKAPVTTDGGKITGYKVARKGTDSKGKKSWSTTVSATTTKVVFKHLKKGTTYTLYVRAVTSQGAGTRVAIKVKL